MSKTKIAILFGGYSAEHEISLLSAAGIIGALEQKRYDPILIGIDRNGRWRFIEKERFRLNNPDPRELWLDGQHREVALIPGSGGVLIDVHTGEKLARVDVAFPVLHGPYGEDGTIQGLLKLADVPFVGADVLGSALGMDKDVSKRLLREAGIPVAPYILACRTSVPDFATVVSQVGVPAFIKPAEMGSSVGVAKIQDESEYDRALENAFRYDKKVLIETFIPGREIECAVLGNQNINASVPGEVVPKHEFYSYAAKYMDQNGADLVIPARLRSNETARIQQLAIRTAKVLQCEGMARVDFFLCSDGNLLVNEINTIPGFTRISMYPKLWEATGLPYPALLTTLINLAIERHGLSRAFKSTPNYNPQS